MTALTKMYRGNTKDFVFTFKINGVAADLTGTSVIFVAKHHVSDDAMLVNLTNTTHDATEGNTTFSITKEMSELFPIDSLDVDLTWIRGDQILTTGRFTWNILEPVRQP